jgi:hypothetical protein
MSLSFARRWGAFKVAIADNAYIAWFHDFATAHAFAAHYPGARVARSRAGYIYVATRR